MATRAAMDPCAVALVDRDRRLAVRGHHLRLHSAAAARPWRATPRLDPQGS